MTIDAFMVRKMADRLPRMNHAICDGLSTHQLKNSESYIDDVWHSVDDSFPKPMKYVGYRKCTPAEEFREATKSGRPRRVFEMSRSDIRMYKYMFTFDTPNGRQELRNRYIYLPFGEHGIMHLNGTQYKITPVIGSRTFNVDKETIYVSSRAGKRIIFGKTSVSFVLNGRVSHVDVVNSPLHNVGKADKVTTRDSLVVHYMLAEFGLQGLMRKYYGTEIKVGGKELDSLVETGEWFVYKSRGIALRGRSVRSYIGSDIRIAVPASTWDPIHNNILGAVFYIIDNFPEALEVEDFENDDLWLRLLSRFIFKTSDSEQKSYEGMITHRDTIRKYMDKVTYNTLKADGISCEDIYDLFDYINRNFHDITIYDDVGSMYQQELSVVKHVLYNVVHNIFMVMFDLQKLQGARVTADRITKLMDKKLRRDKIFTVRGHGELTTDSVACEAKPYNATCNLVNQSKVSVIGGGGKNHGGVGNDPSIALHASQLEVGTYGLMSKSDPTGRSKANCFIHFGQRHYITPRPGLEDYFKQFEKLIKSR